MFTKAKSDLRELVKLTEKIASYDATLAANISIKPEATAIETAACGNFEKSNSWTATNFCEEAARGSMRRVAAAILMNL